MNKSRIGQILAASLEDVRAAEQADADAAAAAAAAAAQAAGTDPAVDPAAAAVDGAAADTTVAATTDAAIDPAAVVDQDAAVVATEDDVALTDPDTLESDLVDVNQAEADVQTNSDAVSELEDVQQGLEALALSLESAHAEGGLTPQAASMFQLAFESYSNRLGEEAQVPSLESFGGQTSRVNATMESMQKVRDVLGRVWEAIKAICIKVKDAIIAFWAQLSSAAERLKTRAAKIAEAGKKTSGAPKSEELELGSLASKLAVGKDVKVSADTAGELLKIVEGAAKFDEEAGKQLSGDINALNAAANSGERVQSAGDLVAPAVFGKKLADGVSTEVLPGNVSFALVVNTGVDKAPSAVNKLFAGGWTVVKNVEKVEVSNDIKIKTLSGEEIVKLAEVCGQIADVAIANNKQVSDDAKKAAQALKSIKFSKDLPEDKVAGVKADMKAFQKRVTATGQASTKTTAYAVNTAAALLNVAQKSLAQHGKTTAVAKAA